MIQLSPQEFWDRFRDELRRRGTVESLAHFKTWTPVAIDSAAAVCRSAGLEVGHELYLDVQGYEQRQRGTNFNWDLRIAFEHENADSWHDELCKLCHIVADLRVLAAYFTKRETNTIQERLQERIDLMGERMTRVPHSEWLFIFGATDSSRNPVPLVAYTLDARTRLVKLPDNNPLILSVAFS